MAVNVAAMVRQPDDVTLSIGRTVPCRPITVLAADLAERLERAQKNEAAGVEDGTERPSIDDVISALADILPTVAEADLRRLGGVEMGIILHHAAGRDVAKMIGALAEATAAGKAPTRPKATKARSRARNSSR